MKGSLPDPRRAESREVLTDEQMSTAKLVLLCEDLFIVRSLKEHEKGSRRKGFTTKCTNSYQIVSIKAVCILACTLSIELFLKSMR